MPSGCSPRRRACTAAAALTAALLGGAAPRARAAAKSYMGWNSYDNLAASDTNETTVLAAARYMATHLLPFGYDVVVIDGGWYDGDGPDEISLDAWGRPAPWPARFPRGMKALAADVHALGLKLGAWLMRGVPVKAVRARTPIANSPFTADAAARWDRNCSWSGEALGTNAPSAAAAAYFASLGALWAEWGLDLVKVDCMYGPGRPGDPVYTEDLVAFSAAMAAVGVAVSLSPGSWVTPHNGSMIAAGGYAGAYRVTQDLWDRWEDRIAPGEYPSGVKTKAGVAAAYVSAGLIGANGTFPDLDMLPLGTTLHNDKPDGSVYGPASPTHLTAPEQRTVMALWCAVRAPLFFGGRLPLGADEGATLALLTNPALLAMHNASAGTRVVNLTGAAGEHRGFAADAVDGSGGRTGAVYLVLLNGEDAAANVTAPLAGVGLPPAAGNIWCAVDAWSGARLPGSWARIAAFVVPVGAHDAAVFTWTAC